MPLFAPLLPILLRWVAGYLIKSAIGGMLKTTDAYDMLVEYLQYRFKCSEELAKVAANTIMNGGKIEFSLTDTITLAQSPEVIELTNIAMKGNCGETTKFINSLIKKSQTSFNATSPFATGDAPLYLEMLNKITDLDMGIKSELIDLANNVSKRYAINLPYKFAIDEPLGHVTPGDFNNTFNQNAKQLNITNIKYYGKVVLNPLLADRSAQLPPHLLKKRSKVATIS